MSRQARACIVGAGFAGFTQPGDPTAAVMGSQALNLALADAGLRRDQIDGLVVHIGSPRGTDYDLAASQLGLNVRFAAQPWAHGRFGATVLQHACMAVECGLADRVVCLAAYNNPRFGTHGTKQRPGFQESLREGGGPHAETPYVGMTAPAAGAAMAVRRYCHRHQVSPDRLAAVALAHRRHAMLNPLARMRKPLTEAEYLAARTIIEPLRLFDCSVLVDGAVALIATRADRADDHPAPVDVLGFQGIHAGPNEFIFGQPGLGTNQAEVFDFDPKADDQLVYRMAGLKPADVDAFYLYDAFTPMVLWALERFGHCRPGEGMEFVQDGRIELGGKLPVDTNGGLLSEGHLNGWGHFLEIISQLRGTAGARQVKDAKVAQWGTCIGDSILFGARRRP